MPNFPLQRSDAIPKNDDFRHMCGIARELNLELSATQIFAFAQWLATLREYYVQVGQELALTKAVD
jgi:hypothetical protein